MSKSSEVLVCLGCILMGFSAGFDFVLSHGFAEAWRAWGERQWQVTFAVIFFSAGLLYLTGMFIFSFLAESRRCRARKAYGERYR
ncbi:hypothetical protein [Candidatus Pantoea formicae]|uniref:hypothetical protein n=1 Tax=Candidatus Pantoea formicae TaxID=2608355 RepID=UPI003EDAE609